MDLLRAWALLTVASKRSIQSLHVMGDSKIVIDWLRGKGRIQVISLDCWKDNLIALISSFQKVSFSHVYREDNQMAKSLSKLALTMDPRKLIYYHCIEANEGPHKFLKLF